MHHPHIATPDVMLAEVIIESGLGCIDPEYLPESVLRAVWVPAPLHLTHLLLDVHAHTHLAVLVHTYANRNLVASSGNEQQKHRRFLNILCVFGSRVSLIRRFAGRANVRCAGTPL